MLPAIQAEQQILDLIHPLDAHLDRETVALGHALGRILATTITSKLDFPHWDNSAMDGYAVRYEDVQHCSRDRPVALTIMEEIPAGTQPHHLIQPGQAARILTGSVMPAGADTVVMQEDTQRDGDRVTIFTAPKPQAFVRHQGAFYQAGAPLLGGGIRIQATEMAILAAAQCAEVAVYRKPRVAILSTGSELVDLEQPLQPGQIVDSNRYALMVLVAQAGAEPIEIGSIPDDPAALKSAIAHAIATADLVISSGGVSVGDYDYIDEILADLGATIHIRSVAVRPGKPLTVATFSASPSSPHRPTLYFGLPGNPVSALVTFWRFVQPAIRKLAGRLSPWAPIVVNARTQQELRSDGKRETYVWGQVQVTNGGYEFHVAGGSQSSGNLINLAGTNALAVIAIGQTQIPAGATVSVLLVNGD
ncbi:molybdopterin molybdotransferase MoeA [Pantanalinema sp. GBBB05]|uniref:molybdopterin molybdotransferase MoeA n=1 Tax=Pantanalinema sp. GBBB05 TaxID=2604139 RepID=UPI001DFDA2A5|nr:molybdopterin molybdotransferase MoeA [Pantanalinema sp. GBBB05]